jgi:predicted membrane-bound mannosyltransferase
MHHDEGIHGYYGWQVYDGSGYTHDAVYHGPFIYHAGAWAFSVFGDSDVTVRVMPALFSLATVMLPVLLRKQLGRWGALLASFLLLISPSFLYFGRFVRNDVFGAFWTLLLFVCMVRFLSERNDRWLYGAAAASSLHFCTKETAYIATAIFGAFLVGRLLWKRFGLHTFWPLLGLGPVVVRDLWRVVSKKKDWNLPPIRLGGSSVSWATVGLALAGLAVLLMLARRWWEGWAQKKPDPLLDLIVVLGTTALPLLSAIPLNVLVKLRGLEAINFRSPNIAPEVVVPAILAIGMTFALSALIGLLWDRRRWAISQAIFWGIFVLLYTSFFGNMAGWITGLVQALGFWLSQQGEKRIHVGPHYYLMLMPVYETVSFLFGLVGGGVFTWRGLTRIRPRRNADVEDSTESPLGAPLGFVTGLLVWWGAAAFAFYSLAGEQAPWLNLHPTLPFVLLAAALVGRVIAYRPPRPTAQSRRLWADRTLLLLAAALLSWAGRPLVTNALAIMPQLSATMARLFAGLAWAVVVVLLWGAGVLCFRLLPQDRRGELAWLALGAVAVAMTTIEASSRSFYDNPGQWWTLFVPLGLVAVTLVVRVALLGKVALRSTALLVFVVLCTYSFGSAWRVAYINNDTPVEMLVYVQTSSDVQRAWDELVTLSTLTTGGNDMVFLYDTEVAWPLEWYFRNHPLKSYHAVIAGPPPPEAGMALVYRDHDETTSPYLERNFAATRYYAFNWWFPEATYLTSHGFVQAVAPKLLEDVDKAGWKQVFQALLNPGGQARIWRYLLYRELLSPIGAREFAVYVRRDLVTPLEMLRDTIPRR